MLRDGRNVIVDRVLKKEGKEAADKVERQILHGVAEGETEHPAVKEFADESEKVQEKAAENAKQDVIKDQPGPKAAREGTDDAMEEWYENQGNRKGSFMGKEAGQDAADGYHDAAKHAVQEQSERNLWGVDNVNDPSKAGAVHYGESKAQSDSSSDQDSQNSKTE